VSPPDRHRSGNAKDRRGTAVTGNCSKIKVYGMSGAGWGHWESSDHQSTNLGVRSSNLFGRANNPVVFQSLFRSRLLQVCPSSGAVLHHLLALSARRLRYRSTPGRVRARQRSGIKDTVLSAQPATLTTRRELQTVSGRNRTVALRRPPKRSLARLSEPVGAAQLVFGDAISARLYLRRVVR
jgi:hypothetical protein